MKANRKKILQPGQKVEGQSEEDSTAGQKVEGQSEEDSTAGQKVEGQSEEDFYR